MNYDPMQYSMAKANVVGGTAENIGMTVANLASKIPQMIKQADAEKKVSIAYRESLNTFAKMVNQIDPSISEEQAKIQGLHFFRMYEGLPLEDKIKKLISGDLSAQKYLEKLQEKVATGKKQAAVQQTVRTKGELGPEPEPGYYDLARTLGEEGQLEEYRQPVPREQGFQTASQTAPDLTYKEYEEMGGKSLPTTEEISKQQGRESQAQYRETLAGQGQQRIDIMKDRLEHDRQKLALMKQKTFKDVEDMTFKDMSKILDQQRQWRSLQISNNGLVKTLNKAIDQITDKGFLGFDTQDELKDKGYEGAADLESLQTALQSANEASIEIENTNDFLKEQQKRLRQGKNRTGAEAAMSTQKYMESPQKPFEDAMKYIRENVTGSISTMTGTTRQLVEMLPEEHRGIIATKINNLKSKGVSDNNILRMILSGR